MHILGYLRILADRRSIKSAGKVDPLSAEIQRLEKILIREANELRQRAGNSKSPAPLTQHEKIMDLAG